MQFRTSSGRRYQTGSVIGQGGEATVYEVAGQPRWLAKIFRTEKPDREQKLSWMITYPPDDPALKTGHRSIAWPVELLYGDQGFAGYLMPHIKAAVPILNVFHPRLRRQTFQGFTQRHLHNTAFNISAALGAIHQRGYVVGDLNESNVLVSPKTLVTLIDTDSFQVQTRTESGSIRMHLCEVGKPEYLPPEMQRRDPKNTVRIPEHDRFALAVLIFQLLMDGNHPFRGRWVGSGERISLPERIEKGYFPYSPKARGLVEPVVDLQMIHPLLTDIFRRCFIIGHETPSVRPSPAEWEQALAETMKTLVRCRNGHMYSPHLNQCPECLKTPVPARRPVPVSLPDRKPGPASPLPAVQAPGPLPPSTGPTVKFQPRIPALPRAIRLPAAWSRRMLRAQLHYYRLRGWLMRRQIGSFILQPAAWGIAGFAVGGMLSAAFEGLFIGRAVGLIGGLFSGALAGAWIEKKVGWVPFFTFFGVLAGLFSLYRMGGPTDTVSWPVAGGSGGTIGLIFGLLARAVDLTVLWAGAGAAGGWFFGEAVAGLVTTNWLGGALSTGMLALVTGVAYAIWRRS